MGKPVVSVRIRGREFRVRSGEDPELLQRVARHLDATLERVAERTGTVDSLDAALLAGLNLARELVEIREGRDPGGRALVGEDHLRPLIDLAEEALA